MFRRLFHAVLLATLAAMGTAAAESLPAVDGPPILSVTGELGKTNDGEAMVFDRPLFDSLPQTEIVTHTSWTDGATRFSGVTLADLLDWLEAEGELLRVTALNDYAADIPVEEVRQYPVLLASRLNGEVMSVREKGPLWVIYPIDDFPELAVGESDAKMVWQVERIEVRQGQ